MSESDEETPTIVFHNGSVTSKVGFAGEDVPKESFPSLYAKSKTPVRGCEKDAHVAEEAAAKQGDSKWNVVCPIKNGIVVDWDGMEALWHHSYYNVLRVDPEEHTVLCTEPPWNPEENRAKTVQVQFETFCVEAVALKVTPILSLFAVGRTTGVVVEKSGDVTHIVPIKDNAILQWDAVGETPLHEAIVATIKKCETGDPSVDEKLLRSCLYSHVVLLFVACWACSL